VAPRQCAKPGAARKQKYNHGHAEIESPAIKSDAFSANETIWIALDDAKNRVPSAESAVVQQISRTVPDRRVLAEAAKAMINAYGKY